MKDFNLNTIQKDLSKIRKAIIELKEEQQWLQTSKLSKADVINRFNRQVDGLTKENRFIDHIFAEMDPFEQRVGIIDGGVNGVNLGSMLCSLFGEEIKRNMADKINALDYEAGPPLSERPKLLEQNADQLLQLETVEEELICEAEKQGWSIDRRLDVRPEIFLEWEANPDV